MAMNVVYFVDLVYRLWQRTLDHDVLRECYPAVKRCVSYTVNLGSGPEGIIRVAGEGKFQDCWEWCLFYGMSTSPRPATGMKSDASHDLPGARRHGPVTLTANLRPR